MTREERFKMDMIDEFKLMCEIVENNGRIILNKHRMLKALEQDNPMAEVDLYSVIKQLYIEREVLDKIRAEIEKKHARAKQISSVLQMNAYTDCLQIIDKYRADKEGE